MTKDAKVEAIIAKVSNASDRVAIQFLFETLGDVLWDEVADHLDAYSDVGIDDLYNKYVK